MAARIDSVYDFTEKGLVELKNWLEPWFLSRSAAGTFFSFTPHGLLAVFDGLGSELTTGRRGDVQIPFTCKITYWTLLADQSGSLQVDVWKDVYANYPPTVADTITAAAPPAIVSGDHNTDSALTGWTTAITEGDTLRFNIDSVATITRATLILKLVPG